MDRSVTFSTPSPSPPSDPAARARSPSGDTDPASEDERAGTAFNSSFQDSGYGSGGGESIHEEDLNHSHKGEEADKLNLTLPCCADHMHRTESLYHLR